MPPEFELLLTPGPMALLGLCIGSFLNVVIHRMPLMMEREWLGEAAGYLCEAQNIQKILPGTDAEVQRLTGASHALTKRLEMLPALGLSTPRSRCPHCGHQLAWHENLPLLGWLRLGGKCKSCKAPISLRYPSIECLTAALFAAVAWKFGTNEATLLWCAFVAALVALAAIDWDTTLLPDSINQPLLWAGLWAALLGYTVPLPQALIGALAGYLSLWSVYHLFKLVTGKEGMGQGDFKLLAALGAWLGWQMVLPIVLMASLIGAMVGIGMKFSGTLRNGLHVPFGPFLAGGGLVVLFAGAPRVMGWLGWA